MSEVLPGIEYRSVLYYMSSLILSVGGQTLNVPRTMVGEIEINKNFEGEIYPLYYLGLNVPIWFYNAMTNDPNNITASFVLQYKLSPENSTNIYDTTGLKNEISGNFKVVIPNVTRAPDSTLQNQVSKNADSYGDNYTFNEYTMVELTLYNTAAWNASFNSLNAVMTSTNMTNALTYCLQSCGISNVLLNNSTNNAVYNEFKIMPTTGVQNILRIIEDYNFHSGGSIVFFDLNQAYILDKNIGARVWTNNEIYTTRLECRSNFSDSLASSSGVVIDTINRVNIIGFNKDAYLAEYATASPLLRSSGQSTLIKIRTSNALMSTLTPNKTFTLNIEGDGAKYNGNYRLYSFTVVLSPVGEFLKCDYEIVLRK